MMIIHTRDLKSTELRQMPGLELRVEQRKSAMSQKSDEINQTYLAGVTAFAEHTFAEKRAAEADAI